MLQAKVSQLEIPTGDLTLHMLCIIIEYSCAVNSFVQVFILFGYMHFTTRSAILQKFQSASIRVSDWQPCRESSAAFVRSPSPVSLFKIDLDFPERSASSTEVLLTFTNEVIKLIISFIMISPNSYQGALTSLTSKFAVRCLQSEAFNSKFELDFLCSDARREQNPEMMTLVRLFVLL